MTAKKKKRKASAKAKAAKTVNARVWADAQWSIAYGELKRGRGRPQVVQPLFTLVAEKLPFDCLAKVKDHMVQEQIPATGVYIAHDSMGFARYAGRGNVFTRLRAHKNAHPIELLFFSIYIVKDKKHEREVETLLIRAAGPHLHFNDRKKRVDIEAGDVRDFEASTVFFERQKKRGRRKKARRK